MRNNDNFRNSSLDRVKPKRHFLRSLFKRYPSDTGLVEDRTSSVTIVRIIGGLLMLHLIIIGGVLLRGHIARGGAGHSSHAGTTAPPSSSQNATVLPPLATAVTAKPSALPSLPVAQTATPRAPLATTTSAPTQAGATNAARQNHITSSATPDDAAEEVENDPTVVDASTAAAVRHRVDRGDTWQGIAQQYGVSAAALQAANPGAPAAAPIQGSVLVVPVASNTSPKQPATRPTPQANSSATTSPAVSASRSSGAAVYTVQRGETLSGIAHKTKVPLKEILRINGIKNANLIQPGMQLKLR